MQPYSGPSRWPPTHKHRHATQGTRVMTAALGAGQHRGQGRHARENTLPGSGSDLPPAFANAVLLGHGHTCSFTCPCGRAPATAAEWSSCNREHPTSLRSLKQLLCGSVRKRRPAQRKATVTTMASPHTSGCSETNTSPLSEWQGPSHVGLSPSPIAGGSPLRKGFNQSKTDASLLKWRECLCFINEPCSKYLSSSSSMAGTSRHNGNNAVNRGDKVPTSFSFCWQD